MPETLFVVQLVKHKTLKLQLMIILLAIAPMAARRCGLPPVSSISAWWPYGQANRWIPLPAWGSL